jgi:hypothetical protein
MYGARTARAAAGTARAAAGAAGAAVVGGDLLIGTVLTGARTHTTASRVSIPSTLAPTAGGG